ncbi:hypothetical protein GGI02_001886 [Coemansia sp. RSA 2322]|nr:hypothetical protein GGI02_001886 [Coemansia sp. RSA 2322]
MPSSDGASERTLNADAPGRDMAGLYNVLGVGQHATPAELKRAYRRLALQHHPDRNPGSAADGADFVRIQYAYDVLSDERKRRIYDRYGEMGIRMAGRVGGELLDPQVSNMLSGLAFASSLMALLFVLFFALLAHRVDRPVSWPYAVVFAPLWVVDLAVLSLVSWALLKRAIAKFGSANTRADCVSHCDDAPSCATSGDERGPAAASSDDSDAVLFADPCSTAAGSPGTFGSSEHHSPSSFGAAPAPAPAPATDATPLLGNPSFRQRRRARRQHRRHRLRALRKFAESQAAYWSPWRVAMPWLAIEALHGILLSLQLLAAVLRASTSRGPSVPRLTTRRILITALDTYWWLLIRVSLVVLVVLKLNRAIAWPWVLVLAPSFVPAIRSIISLCLLRRQLHAMADTEVAQNADAIVLASVAAFVISASFVYSFVALLIWKLSLPATIRLALVLIPVFIALLTMCCFCACLACCLAHGMHAPLDEEQDIEPGSTDNRASATFVPPSRRIE